MKIETYVSALDKASYNEGRSNGMRQTLMVLSSPETQIQYSDVISGLLKITFRLERQVGKFRQKIDEWIESERQSA